MDEVARRKVAAQLHGVVVLKEEVKDPLVKERAVWVVFTMAGRPRVVLSSHIPCIRVGLRAAGVVHLQ